MPAVIRASTYVLPARYFVTCMQTIFLAGDVPEVLLPRVAALLVIGAILLVALVFATRMRLE